MSRRVKTGERFESTQHRLIWLLKPIRNGHVGWLVDDIFWFGWEDGFARLAGFLFYLLTGRSIFHTRLGNGGDDDNWKAVGGDCQGPVIGDF